MEKRYLTYEEFGAVGNGISDDMAAIVACHNAANEMGAPVMARAGAEYYIGGKNLTATIKTSTDFGNAKFIIDDRCLENINAPLFEISSDADYFEPQISSVSKETKTLDFSHGGNLYVRVYAKNNKIYIRKGLNMNSGSEASDCFILDKDGNIKNELNWNYPEISKIYAKSADDNPITVSGGIFITVANRAPSKYTYHARNFKISRSNATVKNLTHYIIGEGEHGAPYDGFISISECFNFTLENCLLTPHFTYYTESKIPGKPVAMGTYDLTLDGAIGAKIIGIRQTVDISDRRYWGLMGSNFSKDLLVEDCVMSRFDAHCGVTNATVKNTTLGHAGLNLIGFGKFVVENSTLTAGALINFRADYGSFFHGELTVKNCTWIAPATARNIFAAHNTGDHDFGYPCGMPERITIDGLKIMDCDADENAGIFVFPNYDSDFSENKPFPYSTPKELILKNVTLESERELTLADQAEQYLETQVISL